MPKSKKSDKLAKSHKAEIVNVNYDSVLSGMVDLLEQARRTAARTVHAVMTATYWEMGRRIVELEQGGKKRADYDEKLMESLQKKLTKKLKRGFSSQNFQQISRTNDDDAWQSLRILIKISLFNSTMQISSF